MQVNGCYLPKSGTEPGWLFHGCCRPEAAIDHNPDELETPHRKKTIGSQFDRFGMSRLSTHLNDDPAHVSCNRWTGSLYSLIHLTSANNNKGISGGLRLKNTATEAGTQ